MFKKICKIAVDELGLTALIDILNANKVGTGITITRDNKGGVRIVEFKAGMKAFDKVKEQIKQTNYKFGTLCKDMFEREIWVEQ